MIISFFGSIGIWQLALLAIMAIACIGLVVLIVFLVKKARG
jgi:hypothetical protein